MLQWGPMLQFAPPLPESLNIGTKGLAGHLREFFPNQCLYRILLGEGHWALFWMACCLTGIILWTIIAVTIPSWATCIVRGFLGQHTEHIVVSLFASYVAICNLLAVVAMNLVHRCLRDDWIGALCAVSDIQAGDLKHFSKKTLDVGITFPFVFAVLLIVLVSALVGVQSGVIVAVTWLPLGCPFHTVLMTEHGVILVVMKLCSMRVHQVIDDLDEVFQSRERIKAGFWPQMARQIDSLDDTMEHVWKVGAPMLLIIFLRLFLAVVVMGAFGGIAYKNQQYEASSGILCLAGVVCFGFLHILIPLAGVTAMCVSMCPGTRSIRRSAGKFAIVAMPQDVQVQYLAFIDFIDRTPMGIELPVIGTVSYAFVAGKARVLLSILPVIFTISSGLLEK